MSTPAPNTPTPNKLFTYSFSTDSDYHTQRNNVFIPYSSCGRTSLVMAAVQAGWEADLQQAMLDAKFTGQEEDYLYLLLQSDNAKEHMQNLLRSGLIGSWALNYSYDEVHLMLDWALNTALDRNVSRFNPNSSDQQILTAVLNGEGAVVSGVFRLPDRTLNHIVSIGGVVLTNEPTVTDHGARFCPIENLCDWLIDDPYGDSFTGYTDQHGNNVMFSAAQFDATFINQHQPNNRWAHLIMKKE